MQIYNLKTEYIALRFHGQIEKMSAIIPDKCRNYRKDDKGKKDYDPKRLPKRNNSKLFQTFKFSLLWWISWAKNLISDTKSRNSVTEKEKNVRFSRLKTIETRNNSLSFSWIVGDKALEMIAMSWILERPYILRMSEYLMIFVTKSEGKL